MRYDDWERMIEEINGRWQRMIGPINSELGNIANELKKITGELSMIASYCFELREKERHREKREEAND